MPTRTTTFLQRLLSRPLRFFDNLSIRAKLFVYGGTIIGLIVGLALYSLYQVTIITGQQIPARVAAREMASALLTMHIKGQQLVVEAESASSEFYLKRQSPNLIAWQENYERLNDNYDKILALYKTDTIASNLAAVKPQLEEYKTTFLALIGAYQQRGYHSFGREGALQLRADALETNLAKKPQAQLALLKLLKTQDDFILHPELNDIADFDAYALQLESQLTSAEDRTLFSEYKTLFHEIVTLYERIGFTANDGLQGQLNQLINDSTPPILNTESEVVALTSNKITAIFQSVFIITLIIIVVGTILAFSIAHLITRRLQQLLAASAKIAGGDFDYRLNTENSDELGRLATAFDTMAERLAHDRKTLKERARALANNVKRFELVSRAVREAIYEWDITIDTLNWGDGLVSEFGYSNKDRKAVVDWWTSRIHPDDAQEVNNSLSKHFARHASTWHAVYRFRKSNGQYIYCQDRGFIEYANNEPVRMVGSLIDISRQKELERAKDEFISIASHQLRTPLGSIRWNLDLLLEKTAKLPKDIRIDIEEAHGSTMRMLGLVGDLLSVARIEQNRVQTMPVPSELVAIIMQAIAEMRPLATERKIHINSASLKNTKVEVVVDPKQFREVIQNLLSNAVKYTPVGGDVIVDIKTEPKDIILSIADTGVGIPPEDEHRLFGKFFRAHNVTTSDTEGSGLGLFVVKSFVEKWSGRIWFTTKLNKGTTFFISIPRERKIPKAKS